jgi:hypothetical protein
MLLDKLTRGAAGNRWQARHLIVMESLSGTGFITTDPIRTQKIALIILILF